MSEEAPTLDCFDRFVGRIGGTGFVDGPRMNDVMHVRFGVGATHVRFGVDATGGAE